MFVWEDNDICHRVELKLMLQILVSEKNWRKEIKILKNKKAADKTV